MIDLGEEARNEEMCKRKREKGKERESLLICKE